MGLFLLTCTTLLAVAHWPYWLASVSLYATSSSSSTSSSPQHALRRTWGRSAVEVYKRTGIKTETAERERGQSAHTPLLGGSADSTADGPKNGSFVSIMASLQIIYISPLVLCCPQAHKAIDFPCCLWQRARGRHSSRCVVGGRRVYGPTLWTHTEHTVQLRQGWPQDCYSYQNDTCSVFAYSWINAVEGCLHFPWALSSVSGFVLVLHISVCFVMAHVVQTS